MILAGDTARIADLIVMCHTLEERDGADSVMFNALCSEISQALVAGVEANDPHVVRHWGESNSRNFIMRQLRNLIANDVFMYRNVSERDEETRRMRRRRVFGLNRQHPLIGLALAARLGLPYQPPEAEASNSNGDSAGINDSDVMATPALAEHESAEAAHTESADDAEVAVLSS